MYFKNKFEHLYDFSITINGVRSDFFAKHSTINTVDVVVKNYTWIPYPKEILDHLSQEYTKYAPRLYGFDNGEKFAINLFGDFDILVEVNTEDMTFWTRKIVQALKNKS